MLHNTMSLEIDHLSPDIRNYIQNIMPKMNGWCTEEKSVDMIKNILISHPSVCVEIGVYSGRSFFGVASALKFIGKGVAIGIEPWTPEACAQGCEKTDENRQWWENLDHNSIMDEFYKIRNGLGLNDIALIFKGTSEQAFPMLRILEIISKRPPIDFIHIDGNHSEVVSLFDVKNYVPLVRPGGDVWFDDTDWQTTKEAQTWLQDKCDLVKQYDKFAHYRKGI